MPDTRGRPRQHGNRGAAHARRDKNGPKSKAGSAPARSKPVRAGFATRKLAVEILGAVIERHQPFDQQWSTAVRSPAFETLEPRDRAFVRLLASTTLRRQGELEHVVRQFLEKPLPEDRGRLWPILLSGAAQLLCLDMPAHAVVDLCVELARADRGARRFDKLTNAVLRRVSERGKEIMAKADAIRLNIPDWIYERWEAHYGAELARRIADASLRAAPLDLSLKSPARDDAASFADSIGGKLLATGSVRVAEHGRIEDLPGYADGQWWVQDAAAALVPRVAGDIAGLTVADLCAAPGGKTASLASAGAKVTAVDLSEKRMTRLNENLRRLKLEVEVVIADVATWAPDVAFDVVHLDAPCTATGTVRRHPDLLRQKSLADITRLAGLQSQMLNTAAGVVRPGGLLIYSTCSLEPEEGSAQIDAFLAHHPQFTREPIDIVALGGEAAWLTAAGDLRTLPCHMQLDLPEFSGMDGFYVARLRRSA